MDKSREVSKLLASAAVLVGLMLSATSQVWAQSAKQLVGTWTLVSATVTQPDGTKSFPFGANGQGLLMFDANGRYSLQICRPDRAKFASNNRAKGTPEENQTTVQGCNPHWGKYTVSEADRAIIFQIERAMFPNWEGIEQKRTFTITGDELKYAVPAASAGGTAEVVWKRVK